MCKLSCLVEPQLAAGRQRGGERWAREVCMRGGCAPSRRLKGKRRLGTLFNAIAWEECLLGSPGGVRHGQGRESDTIQICGFKQL